MEIFIVSWTNITCFDCNTGRINIQASGGTEPYTYQWYNDEALTQPIAGETSFSINELTAGTYYVKATDSIGNWASIGKTLVQPETAASIELISKSNEIINKTKGNATISVTGGTPAYSYQWYIDEELTNPIVGETNPTINNLSAGTYYVKVTDAYSCETSLSIIIELQAYLFDFIPYMENIARNLKDIAHTDDNRRFFRISGIAMLEEYLQELPDVNGTSLMVVENPEGNISDNKGNNFTDEPDFEFYVTKKYKYGDADERALAKNECKKVGQKILAQMLFDKSKKINGLDLLQLNRIPYFPVGPFGDNAIAIYFKFSIIQSANLVRNPDDWL